MRIDGHCDTALSLWQHPSLRVLDESHLDYQRASRFLDASFFAIFVNPRIEKKDEFFRRTLDLLLQDLAANLDLVEPLLTSEQLSSCTNGICQILIGAEGLSFLGGNLDGVEELADRGVRFLGLTWNDDNAFAGGCSGNSGLTRLGVELIELCEEKSIIVDAAHLSYKGFDDLYRIAKKPFIVSHTCCDSISHAVPYVQRNLDDKRLRYVGESGGVVGICFVPDFLGDGDGYTQICRHLKHAANIAGYEHVALGSDFDGTELPQGMSGSESLDKLYLHMQSFGFSDKEIERITGSNWERVLKDLLP